MRILMSSIVDLKKSQHNRPHEFANHLSKTHDLTVISINDWWKNSQKAQHEDLGYFSDMYTRIDYRYLTEERIHPFLQEMILGRWIAREIQPSDFDVHLNYNSLTTGYRLTKSLPTVFDVADDLPAMIRESPQVPRVLGKPGGWLGNSIMKKNLEKSDWITYISKALGEKFEIPNDKSTLLPNGVDTSLFRTHDNAKEELGLGSSFLIGYVGVLREWVDLTTVFRAIKQLEHEDIRMIVVGREGDYEDCVRSAKSIGVEKSVVFAGAVDYSEVPKYISAMDVCLIPFRRSQISQSALPLKLFEYMACGKPIISSEIPAVAEIASSIVLFAENHHDYARQIRRLACDDNLRRDLGGKGRTLVEEHFDWEEISKTLELILCRI